MISLIHHRLSKNPAVSIIEPLQLAINRNSSLIFSLIPYRKVMVVVTFYSKLSRAGKVYLFAEAELNKE
jgi:hypothetical protein